MFPVSEIFFSIQGETSFAGRPAVFIRLSGCNLGCAWCDTPYARESGKKVSSESILEEVRKYSAPLAVITGGEPLLFKKIPDLIRLLIDDKIEVLVETNGSLDISVIPAPARIILDMKPPSSGETKKMNYENLSKLREKDELKFVIADEEDFIWALGIIGEFQPIVREVLFSPLAGSMDFKKLAEMVMRDSPASRVQGNLHRLFNMR